MNQRPPAPPDRADPRGHNPRGPGPRGSGRDPRLEPDLRHTGDPMARRDPAGGAQQYRQPGDMQFAQPPAREAHGDHAPAHEPRPGLDRKRASAARRHSIFVALMKGLLPSLAVCIVLALVFYSQGGFAPDLPDNVDFDPGEIDITDSTVRMISPLLTGLDNDNRRFEVTAVSAEQDPDNPGLVTLEGINGSMEIEDGGWLTLDATSGTYDSDTNMMTLEDAIEVTTSAGYVVRLRDAEVDFKKGEVATLQPVVVYMDAGVITGNAMTLFHKERRVLFSNGVSMTINGDPSQGSAER